MGEQIYSISEAFSMQPTPLHVGGNTISGKKIARIMLQEIKCNGDPFEAYIGYDADGNKLFHYLKNTVNVHYYQPK